VGHRPPASAARRWRRQQPGLVGDESGRKRPVPARRLAGQTCGVPSSSIGEESPLDGPNRLNEWSDARSRGRPRETARRTRAESAAPNLFHAARQGRRLARCPRR
jgi:hypothetical protein